MEKSTVIEHEVINEIKIRRSGRAYAETPVEPEKIRRVLEAARWAPSSSNEQPWKYVLATKDNSELYNKIFDTLADGNKSWVKHVPVILVSLARKTTLKTGTVNRFALHDTGAANTLLALESAAIGLMAHQMGGYDYEKLKTALNVPDAIEIASVIALGYAGNLDELPEALKIRELAPRERYKQEEFVQTKGF
jgi:nitroreductase